MLHRTLLVALLLATPALSQPMPGMSAGQGAPEAITESPATAAFRRASEKMIAGMNTPPTGDTDRDFVAAMLPRHQGAIDMANVELRYGHDPALKQLAHDIIVAQNKEVVFMRRWQMQRGGKRSP